MKSSTQRIQNLVTKDLIDSAKSIQANATKYSWSNDIWELSVSELQEMLVTVLIFLSKNSNLLIVDQYSQNKRNTILNNLAPISQHLQEVKNGNNYLPNILWRLEVIYDLIYPNLIASTDTKEIASEIAEIKLARKDYISTTKEFNKLLEYKDKITEFVTVIPEINTKLSSSEWSYQRIRELEQTIEQKTDAINAFAENILEYKDNLNKVEKEYETLSQSNQTNTDELIRKNEKLHTKVAELLSSTIWWKSSEKLKERANQVKYTWWVRGIIITTLLIWWGSFFVYKMINVWSDTVGEIIIKYLFISPLIILDIFFTTQYLSAKKLKEEYEFKAIISGTLETYINLLNDNENRKEHKDFITTTANRIFSSPISDNDSVKFSDIKDISKQAIQTTIDKFAGK